MDLFLVGLLGLIVGSFVNCVVYRSGNGISYITGRSFCPRCKHQLSWLDNIPLLSFLLLKGKCRYCFEKISLQYPLVELATAIEFLLVYLLIGNNYSLLAYGFWMVSAFSAIFLIDLKYGIIPDEILAATLIVSIPYALVASPYFMLTALISFLIFLGIYRISKEEGIGFGDVKMSFVIGFILGYPKTIYALYLAFLTGALTGVILIISHKRKLKGAIPFGPFLCLGTIIFFFWGDQIIRWFTAHFF